MGKIKKKSKLKPKSKSKEKKQVAIVPRLRLEPRLTPTCSTKNKYEDNSILDSRKLSETKAYEDSDRSEPRFTTRSSKKNLCKQDEDGNSIILDTKKVNEMRTDEVDDVVEPQTTGETNYEVPSCVDSYADNREDDEGNEAFDIDSMAERNEAFDIDSMAERNEAFDIDSMAEGNMACQLPTEGAQSFQNDSEEEEDFEDIVVRKGKKSRKVRNSFFWNDKQLLDLVVSLQSEGFADLNKVAEIVKTKNENDIHTYLRRRILDTRRNKKENQRCPGRPVNKWTTVSLDHLGTWPNIRKWKKLAYDQILPHVRRKDLSKAAISSLCKRFYEEEKEPSDPQVINTKLIYKYMMVCMAGEVPPQLPPKESALVLDLLREVRSMPMVYDLEEELKFLHEFKEATKFKPFQVKDEFKKRFKKAHDQDALGPNTVSVPESVFMDLSRHKRIVQSFNPLITPVWMIQKEQELLEKYFEEPSVYVD